MRRALGVVMVALWAACSVPASALEANSTILLSRPSGLGTLPVPGDNDSFAGRNAVSGDGRFVVFTSNADDLGVQDTRTHVWVRDTFAATTTLVDRAAGGGEPGNGNAFSAAISRDGGTVCFISGATNLVAGAAGPHVFVVTLATGAIVVADRATGATGALGNSDAGRCALDATGARVAFQSQADNLVPGDGNSARDVFVRDLGADSTVRASVNAMSIEAPSGAFGAAISANGLKVVFESVDPLVTGDTNGSLDVFVRDLQAGTTVRASVGTGSVQAFGASFDGVINDDGTYVAFSSDATTLDLGPDTNGRTDVFWRSLGADTTLLVSRETGGNGALGDEKSEFPAISGNGLGVAFESPATNLGHGEPPPPDGRWVYLRQLGADDTFLRSRATGSKGAPANKRARNVSLGTATTVATWESAASNLDADASGEFSQVFKHDSAALTTTLVSRPSGTTARNAAVRESVLFAGSRAVSADGRLVVFGSPADGLDPAAAGPFAHVFIRDAVTNTTTLVSRGAGPSGAVADGDSDAASIAASGSHVTFFSRATNLLPGVTTPQVYVRDLATGALELASRADGPSGAPAVTIRDETSPYVSADGRRVVFTASDALVPADTNGRNDVYVRDLATDTTTLVSVATGGGAGSADSSQGSLSDDGTRVAFISVATDLLASGPTSGPHVYIRDLVAGTTVLVDQDQTGAPGPGGVGAPEISGSGNRVAFFNLEPLTADTIPPNGAIFVRDLAADVTLLASREDGATSAAVTVEQGLGMSINAGGTRVGWVGAGGELPGGEEAHAYVRDLAAGTTRLVSAINGTAATPGDARSLRLALDAAGSCVAFSSSAGNLTVPAYSTRDFDQVYLRAVDGGCLASATTSTTLVTTSTTLPPGSGTPIPAKTVVVRPGKLVKLVAKGFPAPAGALPDPTVGGGTLVVEGTMGSASFPLPASGWKAVGRRAPKGFKFKGAGCRVTLLRQRIKAACRGETGALQLPEPGPLEILLVAENRAYCAACGGTSAGRPTRVFKRRACPAPVTCP